MNCLFLLNNEKQMIDVTLESSWRRFLDEEFEKEYFKGLSSFLNEERNKHLIFPAKEQVFNAFNKCPFSKIKVVILGQDPYHGLNQANGLSFSVQVGTKFPPSLRNIFKELKDDLGIDVPFSGDLGAWCNQGVLLLNATLTVRSSDAGSHQGKGWEVFTDAVIQEINDKKENVVFVLWGAYAKHKGRLINSSKHLTLHSPHPSPFSARKGFFGSKPFSKINKYLGQKGKEEIVWDLFKSVSSK